MSEPHDPHAAGTAEGAVNPYDSVAYPSKVFSKTHPDRLATIAALCGLRAAPPDRCRMLELGCGDGTNLISCAIGTPRSEYVGVDLAASPIARGNTAAAELGVRNVKLLVGDLTAPEASWGTFDYIAAHGVYSWVPPAVREVLLATVAKLLRPNGVAYVSFDAQPGGMVSRMLREAMIFHAGDWKTDAEYLARSTDLLKVALAARVRPDDPWDRWLRAEIAVRAGYDPGTLRHDDLNEYKDPIWFHEFVEHAERCGLQYLAEAEWSLGREVVFPQSVRDVLARMEPRVVREQYVDLLRVRRFRQPLLVNAAAKPSASPCLDRIEHLQIAAEVGKPETEVPLERDGRERFSLGHSKSSVETDVPLVRAALRVLHQAWPGPLPFKIVHREALRRLTEAGRRIDRRDGDRQKAELRAMLLGGYDAGRVSFSTFVPAYEARASSRPIACPLVRRMARKGRIVVSRLQRPIDFPDDRGPRLLQLLDGTRDRKALLDALRATEAPPAGPPPGADTLDEAYLDAMLLNMAIRGLLIG